MSLVLLAAAGAIAATTGSANTVSLRPVALTVSPARTVLVSPSSRSLQVNNLGREPMAVDVGWRPLARGSAPRGWLRIAPGRLVLRSGARALLTVRAGSGASPGDHQLLVLVTGRPTKSSGIAVRLRVGVRVRIRAPGRLARRLALAGLRARRLEGKRALLVSVANRGNVTEQLRGRLTVTLVDRSRVVSRLRLRRAREIYPGARAVIVLPYAGGVHGVVTAIVRVRLAAGVRPLERRYRLLLRGAPRRAGLLHRIAQGSVTYSDRNARAEALSRR